MTMCVLGLAAGCGGGAATAAGPLLSDPGNTGYALDHAASRDRQSLAAFAASTPADPDATRRELRHLHARTTASRVWTQPDGAFVLDEAVRFDNAADAGAFTRWYRGQMAARSGQVFPVPDLAAGYAYVTGGNGRAAASTNVFVEGVVFTAGPQVFLVETGGPSPASLAPAQMLARRQSAVVDPQEAR